VRGFTQDDAHIFCTPDQVLAEVGDLLDFCFDILKDFGFEHFELILSVRDPEKSEKYAGTPEDWEMAQNVLAKVLEDRGIPFHTEVGEAVFYGPKIDIKLKDSLGRRWQATTIQFDFTLPQRLDVTYIGEDGGEHQVVMIHRALFGSFERFMGVLIEHYAGAFPLWQAPLQAVVLPIADAHHDYTQQVLARLKESGIRAEADLRNEKIGYKIREHQLQKIPFMLVCGSKEVESGTVAVRNRFEGDLGPSSLDDFIAKVKDIVETKAVRP
jgi:threonyl-tRNA synthetase